MNDWVKYAIGGLAFVVVAIMVIGIVLIPVVVAAGQLVTSILTGSVSTLAPLLVSVAALGVGLLGLFVALYVANKLLGQTKKHPLAVIGPVLSLLGGLATNLIVSAVGFNETNALIFGAMAALMSLAGSAISQLGTVTARVLAGLLVVLAPTIALGSIVVTSDSGQIAQALAELDLTTVLLLMLVIVTAIGVAYLLVRTSSAPSQSHM